MSEDRSNRAKNQGSGKTTWWRKVSETVQLLVVYVKLCKKVFMAEADSVVGYAAVRMKSFFCSFQ